MKRELPIHELLKWMAFEVLKEPDWGGPSMFSNSFWELATRVDNSGQYSPEDLNGVCHRDARLLAGHVARLPTHPIRWARDQRWLLGDCLMEYLKVEDLIEMGLLVRPRARRNGKISHARVSREMVSIPPEPTPTLVMRYAGMGIAPEWDTPMPRLVPVLLPNEQPIEDGPIVKIDGKMTKTSCPIELDPCPATIALKRFNYHRWVRALEELTIAARDLSEYVALPSGFDRTPWFSPRSNFQNSDSFVLSDMNRSSALRYPLNNAF